MRAPATAENELARHGAHVPEPATLSLFAGHDEHDAALTPLYELAGHCWHGLLSGL